MRILTLIALSGSGFVGVVCLPPGSTTPARATQAENGGVPPLLRHEKVLGVPILDVEGARLATLEGLLVDENTGELIGALMAPAEPAYEGDARVLMRDAWDWISDEGRIALRTDRAAFDEHSLEGIEDKDHLDERETAVVRGVIKGVELVGEGPSRILLLKVNDDANLLHRVLVGAADLVLRRVPGIATVQGAVEIEGLQTRDAKGLLLVALSVGQGNQTLRLRDPTGRILWRELAQNFLSLNPMSGMAMATKDGTIIPLRGCIVDTVGGRVDSLRLQVETTERLLPWQAFERGENGTWRTRALEQDPSGLPELEKEPEREEAG